MIVSLQGGHSKNKRLAPASAHISRSQLLRVHPLGMYGRLSVYPIIRSSCLCRPNGQRSPAAARGRTRGRRVQRLLDGLFEC